VQIAKTLGAQVFSTVDTSKNEIITAYGAMPIDYKNLTVDQYVEQYTQGEGFDIILDNIGGETLDASFKAAKQYVGHVLSILGWGTHSLAPLSFRGATYSGVFTLYPLITGKGRKHHGDILREATKLIEDGKLKPQVDPENYTLETIADAYQALELGKAKGKVVISINN
jgi:NADPH:quinone reductase-like Zn-dependent oxidoreductase